MVDVKQVIVVRTDLNMRKGKMIAQGAHASIAFLSCKLRNSNWWSRLVDLALGRRNLTYVERLWIDGSFKKICVQVGSEEELLNIKRSAEELDINVNLIIDSGLTEFAGLPTMTCLALGPDYADKIDKVTGGLKLL